MKKLLLSLLSLILVVTLVACGGSTTGTDSTKGGPSASGDSTSAGGPSKILNVAISENATTLDPHNCTNFGSIAVSEMVFEALIECTGENTYVPLLAESWEISEDQLEWTFHLRKGVKFHNGEDFNADDVIATFKRLLDNKDTLSIVIKSWGHLVKAEAIDEYTVKVVLNDAKVDTLHNFSMLRMIPDEAYAQYGDDLWIEQMMPGTGPWVFQEWIDGQYAHFKKNENYWNKEYDSYYDEVYLRHVLEPSSAIAAHINGDINAYITSGGINPDLLSLYNGTENRIELVNYDTSAFMYLGLSCKDGSVFQDIKVREAFDIAIDRQLIVDSIFSGNAIVPNNIISKGVPGYNPNLPPIEYNPEKARQLLAESSYDGREIVLSSNTSTLKAEEILTAVSAMLNEVGFNTSISVVESATLLEMRRSGNYDVYLVIAMHSGADPNVVLQNRIMIDQHNSFYVNEELNALIAKQARTFDPAEREKILFQIGEILAKEHAPLLPLVQNKYTQAIDYGVTGFYLRRDGDVKLCYPDYDPSLLPK